MTNGKIDDAQVKAILGGDDDPFKVYVAETLQQLVNCAEDEPAIVAAAICTHKKTCRGESRRAFYGFLTALGACVGLATPYILQLFR